MKYFNSLLIVLLTIPVFGQNKMPDKLFCIERSKNANTIFYSLNLDDQGRLNTQNPINVYWVKLEESGKIEPLTWMQSRLGYGVQYLKIRKEEVVFQIVSFSGRTLHLKPTENGYAVFIESDNGLKELKKVFVQIDGNSFIPDVAYVKLYEIDPTTNKKTEEIIYN